MKAWMLLVVASCGRFDFVHTAADAQPDAPPDAPVVTHLIHQYSLDETLLDDLGGPPLDELGGSLLAGGGYQFGLDQGLRLIDAMPQSAYSIELTFDLAKVDGYNKVIDFKNLGADSGLYVHDSQLEFVVIPVTGCPGNDCYDSPSLFAADSQATVTLSRDGSGTVTAYVGSTKTFTFVDDGAVGTFNGNVVNFFVDDTGTMTEASPGIVRQIRIFDAAVAPN